MMTKASVLALLSASVLSAACGPDGREDGIGDGDGDGSGSGSGSGTGSGTASECTKMDIVFVVDNSGSMQEEQTNLAQNFPMFAQTIKAFTNADGQPLDFRVAVTTTGRTLDYNVTLPGFGSIAQHEEGEDGAFKADCGSTNRWLDNTDPNLEANLACRANVGTEGPSIEMPLLMTKWALADRMMDVNQGFLRQDALLAIVMLTDEDDSSTTENGFTMDQTGTTPTNWNPADQVAFLDQLKGHRSRWAAAAIAGDGACSSSFGNAADGVRLKEFVQAANSGGSTQAVFSSICEGNLNVSLQQALAQFQNACGGIIL